MPSETSMENSQNLADASTIHTTNIPTCGSDGEIRFWQKKIICHNSSAIQYAIWWFLHGLHTSANPGNVNEVSESRTAVIDSSVPPTSYAASQHLHLPININ